MTSESWLPLRNGLHGTTAWYRNIQNPLSNIKEVEIITARRLRRGCKPLIGRYYEPLNVSKLIFQITSPNNIFLPEVKTSLAFLLGSILFSIGGALDLSNIHGATYLFVIGSTAFLLGAYWQIDQMIKTHQLHLSGKIDYLSCSFIAVLSSKIGTLAYNLNSYSSYLHPKAINWAWLMSETIQYTAGSFLFVIAGYFHIVEIGHGRGILTAQIQSLEWWIAITFALGSLFFLISAILGFPGDIQTAPAVHPNASDIFCIIGGLTLSIHSILSLAECSEAN